ncbi:DUF262 domain-containing protein [Serratia ureilytica]|uniref:DUF262 domain-containing protein n=1 Tax=Serratia ureilytica TaxID=300181 RepID=UPI001C1DE8BF|nr:DUF262 domain-containing protein [Serratia ureilytica]QWU35636.1 DUF262 domain-containing protein [Serratia ureilytica]UUW16498.1 DUF262 domain-containing protein [Serratia ureilytica]
MNNNQDFIEFDEQAENENDIDNDDLDFSSAVLSSTDWTTETIINQINKNNIELNPSFQRRDAWTKSRKSNFIESLILGLPIPQLVLAERKDKRGTYIVLDGKQRLLTIRQFAASNSDNDYIQLKLHGLDIRKDLVGKSLETMKQDVLYFDDVSSFENQPIRTVVIRNWPNEEFLYHVFLRLNTGSVQLAPQELRQALHPGPFVSFIDNTSAENISLKEILKIDVPDFRMRDNELLLRYISFKSFMSDYSGNIKRFLDDTCEFYNINWQDTEQSIKQQVSDFDASHQRVKEIFGNHSYRKWFGGAYEVKFNRAIFDIMIGSFSIEEVRKRSLGHENEIEGAFKKLCAENYEFLSSIETTTKSLMSTYHRFMYWYSALNEILGNVCPTLTFQENRIRVG